MFAIECFKRGEVVRGLKIARFLFRRKKRITLNPVIDQPAVVSTATDFEFVDLSGIPLCDIILNSNPRFFFIKNFLPPFR
jgi:hypothetical protein